jgi:hypothetical protein
LLVLLETDMYWLGDEGVFTGQVATRLPDARAGLHLKSLTLRMRLSVPESTSAIISTENKNGTRGNAPEIARIQSDRQSETGHRDPALAYPGRAACGARAGHEDAQSEDT